MAVPVFKEAKLMLDQDNPDTIVFINLYSYIFITVS